MACHHRSLLPRHKLGSVLLFGTEHPEMAEALLSHCLKVQKSSESSDDHNGNDERIFMLTSVAEIEPRDTFERMLAVQMAATHVAMIRSGRWLANAAGTRCVTTKRCSFIQTSICEV